MKPARILMFASYLPPEYSGAAAQAFVLANKLRARGHHVEFVTQSRSGLRKEYDVEGFGVTALPMRIKAKHQEFSVWSSLLQHLWQRRHQIDILHGHGAYYTQSILGPYGRLLGKPTLVKASLFQNDLFSLSNSRIAPIHRRFLALIDAYVAISADIEGEFTAKGLDPERVWAIPNGVDVGHFQPVSPTRRREIAAELDLPVDRDFALFVGVFDERKRIAWLVEQWLATEGFGSGLHLLAVGPTSRDDYGEALRRRLCNLAGQRPDLITICNFTTDIRRYYQASRLLVFPSCQEGLPNTVLEAMACGLPCVVARVSGSRELVQDGVNGTTFDVNDAQSLKDALARLTEEGPEALGTRGRAIAVERFDMERIVDRYEALYEHILKRRAGQRT